MFGEYDEMMVYHGALVYMLLGLLIFGMLIPFLSKDCAKTIKRKRIYMFFSHGLINIVAFAGLIGFVFVQMDFNMSMAVMILFYLLLSAIESIKYLSMLKTLVSKESCNDELRAISIKYTLINIAMVGGIIIYKVMEHKDAVPLP
jgi:cation transport ATPase